MRNFLFSNKHTAPIRGADLVLIGSSSMAVAYGPEQLGCILQLLEVKSTVPSSASEWQQAHVESQVDRGPALRQERNTRRNAGESERSREGDD